MTQISRILGERSGSEKGPLLLILTQVHGNEPAGYYAVQELFQRIDQEYQNKADFDYRGRIVALRGNLAAIASSQRFINEDFNRIWTDERVKQIQNSPLDQLKSQEERELKGLLETIQALMDQHPDEQVVLLDLHTTTAKGGMFLIPSTDDNSRALGLNIHAPLLHGFLDGLEGTILHYFRQKNFPKHQLTSICFEAGQHDSLSSVGHAVSAIIQCFTAMGGFYAADIEMKHELRLSEENQGLPKEGRLAYCHRIHQGDNFKMRSDKIYRNFDPIYKGELLAEDKNGPIYSPLNGLILMPLYQKQGNDGFFIIEDLDLSAPKLGRKIPKTILNA